MGLAVGWLSLSTGSLEKQAGSGRQSSQAERERGLRASFTCTTPSSPCHCPPHHLLLLCTTPDTPSPLPLLSPQPHTQDAVQELYARRFGIAISLSNFSRALLANLPSRRLFCAPPLQALRSPRGVRSILSRYLLYLCDTLLASSKNTPINPRLFQATPPPVPTSSSPPSLAASTPSPSSQVCAAPRNKRNILYTQEHKTKGQSPQVTVSVPRSPSPSRPSSRPTMCPLSGSRSTSPAWSRAASTPRSSSASPSPR